MNNIIKRGLGKINSLITRGYGKVLLVIVTPEAPLLGGYPVKPARFLDVITRYIKTKHIRVPNEKEEITCDVILLNPNDLGYMKDAILLSKKYDRIKVYDIKDVKIK